MFSLECSLELKLGREVMENPLEKEFQYYLDNQDELVKEHNGKFLVIKDRQVLGAYGSEQEAVAVTVKTHELGTFLVQYCEPGDQAYTQTFHSRVTFA
jgi:hypothetical protein